jgi:NADPH:quinone reductase-like Zn-dependent oxidoreductase
MRAAVCRTNGPPEVVQVEEWAVPRVGAGEVRVRVRAAAVNFPDVLLVAGKYQIPAPLPFVVGSEFAGIVEEVADDVEHVWIGDRVTGTGLYGAFAEQLVSGAATLNPIPAGLSDADAAAAGVAHRTAIHVLRSTARLAPGEELVVLGAGGGVGMAAVQLGTVFGATVTAVASSDEKLEAASANGAHRVVRSGGDLRAALREALPEGADIVVDPVGGEVAEPALRSLRYGGRFVSVGYASGEIPRIALNLVLLKGVEVRGFEFLGFATHEPDALQRNEAELRELLASGRVRPHIGATFPLAEAAVALRYVADGRAIGKVVIDART